MRYAIGMTVIDQITGQVGTLCRYISVPKATGMKAAIYFLLSNNIPTSPEAPTRWRSPEEVAKQPRNAMGVFCYHDPAPHPECGTAGRLLRNLWRY